jgi:hypothetical protein
MEKNKKVINIVIAVIAILVLVFITITATKSNKKAAEVSDQTIVELNNAIKSDTTKDITESIDNISLDDSLDTDISAMDQEIEKL